MPRCAIYVRILRSRSLSESVDVSFGGVACSTTGARRDGGEDDSAGAGAGVGSVVLAISSLAARARRCARRLVRSSAACHSLVLTDFSLVLRGNVARIG